MVSIAHDFLNQFMELYLEAKQKNVFQSKDERYQNTFRSTLKSLPRKLTKEETDQLMEMLVPFREDAYGE